MQDLDYLLRSLEGSGGSFSQRYRKLSKGLAGVVQDYGLLSFVPLSITDTASVKVRAWHGVTACFAAPLQRCGTLRHADGQACRPSCPPHTDQASS